MTNPLSAAHYADQAGKWSVTLCENERLGRDTYRLRFDCPDLAKRILPGQFVMLRLADCDDPLLGRPLALYDTVVSDSGDRAGIDLVYLVVGKLTSRLASLGLGARLDVWGPLGNGFLPRPARHLVMVAGGIGQTPFVALGQEYRGTRTYGDPPRQVEPAKEVTLCYGARTREFLAGVADFQRLGIDVRLATDDGTAGHRGLVTDLLEQTLSKEAEGVRVVCCGPEPMMERVAEITARAGVPCEVSLETPMACGIGICFSCVAKVRQPGGGWDYKRTCVDGPVFAADQIVW